MEMPSLQQLRPILLDNFLVCLPRLQYPCRIDTGNPLHFLSVCLVRPSTRLLLVVFSHPKWSFRDKESCPADGQGRWPGNAGWLCVDIQNLGSNECLWVRVRHQPQVNGSVHHPTGYRCQDTFVIKCNYKNRKQGCGFLLVPSKIHHFCPSC